MYSSIHAIGNGPSVLASPDLDDREMFNWVSVRVERFFFPFTRGQLKDGLIYTLKLDENKLDPARWRAMVARPKGEIEMELKNIFDNEPHFSFQWAIKNLEATTGKEARIVTNPGQVYSNGHHKYIPDDPENFTYTPFCAEKFRMYIKNPQSYEKLLAACGDAPAFLEHSPQAWLRKMPTTAPVH